MPQSTEPEGQVKSCPPRLAKTVCNRQAIMEINLVATQPSTRCSNPPTSGRARLFLAMRSVFSIGSSARTFVPGCAHLVWVEKRPELPERLLKAS